MYGSPYDNPDMYVVPRNRFANASVFCGVAAIFTISFIYLPIMLGSLSIIFAILSRKGTLPIPSLSRIGIICACIGIAGAIGTLVVTIKMIPTLLSDPAYRQTLERMFKSIYGSNVDMDQIFSAIDKIFGGNTNPNFL